MQLIEVVTPVLDERPQYGVAIVRTVQRQSGLYISESSAVMVPKGTFLLRDDPIGLRHIINKICQSYLCVERPLTYNLDYALGVPSNPVSVLEYYIFCRETGNTPPGQGGTYRTQHLSEFNIKHIIKLQPKELNYWLSRESLDGFVFAPQSKIGCMLSEANSAKTMESRLEIMNTLLLEYPKLSKPVVNINWHEAHQYSEWLSAKTNRNYHLPSEQEWMRAMTYLADDISGREVINNLQGYWY